MSEYINFFIRYKNNFIPLFDYCRSSYIYKVFREQAPYGKVSAIKYSQLNGVYKDLRDWKEVTLKAIKEKEKTIEEISAFNNSVSDKMEAIYEIKDTLCELEDDAKNLDFALSVVEIIIDIIDTARFTDDYEVDLDNYIYAGIEVGIPTLEDLEEK